MGTLRTVPAGVAVVSALLGFATSQSLVATRISDTGPDSALVATAKKLYENARTEATNTGQSGPAIKAYLASLPTLQGLFVVEGDMLMSESEVVHTYLAQKIPTAAPGAELKLNKLPSGADDVYPRAQRQLTYAVDRSTFTTESEFDAVVDKMGKATRRWEDACQACGITFVHEPDKDAAPSTSTVNFVVRHVDAHGNFIAAAFFPHDPPLRRFLNIDSSYFTTTFDSVGVLRHELGHVLGYRHEHIAGVPGCYVEDGNWRPLSPYDSKSVMHYLCGGGGTLALDLSPTDISSHRLLYGN